MVGDPSRHLAYPARLLKLKSAVKTVVVVLRRRRRRGRGRGVEGRQTKETLLFVRAAEPIPSAVDFLFRGDGGVLLLVAGNETGIFNDLAVIFGIILITQYFYLL